MLMASLWKRSMLVTLVAILATQLPLSISIGVNYGMIGDNLPSAQAVIGLYNKCGIQLLRLFDPNPDALQALTGSNLQVSLGVRNEDVPILASGPEAANSWVNTNIAPYKGSVNIQWVTVGNEIIPGAQASSVAQAMQNLNNAINSIGLTETKVTTVISMAAIGVSYPPSAGAFSNDAADIMRNVATFLAQTGSPLMVNVYPYFPYSSDPAHISFEYATFQAQSPVVGDGALQYSSLFDAMVDAVYAALEKVGAPNVPIVISETGWPTAGNEPYTSIQNAQTYNQNLIKHVQSGTGTPKRPNTPLTVFIFAMFNEDQKPNAVEQNWGIFDPNMTSVYPLLNC